MELTRPIVSMELIGEVHIENGRLIVGDTDVVKKFRAHYGGHRQLGRLQVILELLVTPTSEVSQSGDGLFCEASEP